MPHGICINNGKASMFYVGDPPWHGLGTQLCQPATAAEAIRAANLDWDVLKVPLYAKDSRGSCRIPDEYAMVPADRWGDDDCPIFGKVGKYYTPLQNRDAFAFFDPIVGNDAAIYHTAGALGAGERIWILAKLPSDIRIVGDDIVSKFLLLSNSHDGKGSVQIKFTPIRVVCQNTLTQALRKGQTVRVPHLKNLEERLRFAERTLGFVNARFSLIEQSFQEMATVQLDTSGIKNYLTQVFPNPSDLENQRALSKAEEKRQWAEYFFENGEGNQLSGVRGTLWAAYNGIAELIDHRLPRQAINDQHLNSVWFGEGYLAKARAYKVAIKMMQGHAN